MEALPQTYVFTGSKTYLLWLFVWVLLDYVFLSLVSKKVLSGAEGSVKCKWLSLLPAKFRYPDGKEPLLKEPEDVSLSRSPPKRLV